MIINESCQNNNDIYTYEWVGMTRSPVWLTSESMSLRPSCLERCLAYSWVSWPSLS